MTNPAGAKSQVIGVFAPQWQTLMAQVLRLLGSQRALVVHSDGLDEFSLTSPTRVVELRDGAITEYSVEPADVGLTQRSMSELTSADPAESLAHVRTALTDADSAAGQIVAFNAGAALYTAGLCDNLKACLLYTSPSPRDGLLSRMPSSA